MLDVKSEFNGGDEQEKMLAVKTEAIAKMCIEKEQFTDDEVKNGLMDLIWKAIDGLVKPEKLLAHLTEQKSKIKHLESLVADIISIIDIEIGSYGSNSVAILSSNNTELTNPAMKKEKFYSIINHLRPFLTDELLKERLEIETLEALKLIVKKESFNQKYIKIKTRLFYKQQKFNLLREETEGYSKLITELGQTTLNSKILENIQSLIGCFNLDPNRVLDIILESFENSPSMHGTFIPLLKNYKSENETICQIIGFKFQSLNQKEKQLQQLQMDTNLDQQQTEFNMYQLYQAQSKANMLYAATSYLLKYDMIDLDLLMPHLYPSEQQIQQSYKEEFDSARQYAKKLTMVNLSETNNSTDKSGSKTSSSNSSSDYTPVDYQQQHQLNQQEELKNMMHAQLSKLENQKVLLAKSLVEIGDYKTALRIIEKLPQWFLATYPDVSVDICNSIDANMCDLIYKKCNSLSKYFKDKYGVQNDVNIELDDLLGKFVELILPILSAMGPGVAYNTVLYTKLIRICISFLETNGLSVLTVASAMSGSNQEQSGKEQTPPPQSASNAKDVSPVEAIAALSPNGLAFYNQIYTILNDVLMPSLSMISMNPCLAIELWSLLKMFPYEMRYYLYNNWRLYSYKHFPQLIRTKAECQEKIKYLLKRLTKENVKIHGRQIGKLSHNNPIIICDFILTQIQRYDNFIIPIVDSLKFLTPLSYDVLSYCTIIAISDADKDKMKHDSTSISTWLKSVATFCALAFKKYPIELTAIIQYVINQLKNRKSYDLLILQEIVQKMCGIEVLSEVNDLQLEAMAGGDILRQEAGYFNPIRNIKKCANRLKEALADHGLILPLCILLSQQRDYIVFTDQAEREQYNSSVEKQHLKLTGSLYDQCQDSLVQFSQFLSSTLTTEEYIHIFPKIDELVNEYHMSADVAFFLSRPMYAHHIQSKYDELRRMDRSTKTAEKPTKTQRYLESIDVVMQPVIDLVRTLHTAKIWEDMSPLFYTTFWTLSMNDCFVPVSAYDKQKASLKQKLNALDDNQDLTTTKKRKEKEKLIIMLEKLTEEENKQKDHVQHVKARFEKEKEFWFPQKSKTKNETITVFLQLCIFSRCLFTQIDAYYCAKFIQIIHSLKTPNFSTIICYDRIFSDISYSIASLTDNEARKYGRFLLGLLETVMSWHADPIVFDAECAQFPGFLTVFRNALNTGMNTSTSTNKQEQLDYENFRHVCHKWHYKLTKSFIVCLESEEYLQMRNSLIILTKILPHYPRLTGFCSALEKRVEKIKQNEKDKKQDIHTLALVYLGQLKQRKSHMVDEAKFHLKEQTATAQSSLNKSATDASKSSKESSSTASKPTEASKFKPPSSSNRQAASSTDASSSISAQQSVASKQITAVLQANANSNTQSSAITTSVSTTPVLNLNTSVASISFTTPTTVSNDAIPGSKQLNGSTNGSASSRAPTTTTTNGSSSSTSSTNTNGNSNGLKETTSSSSRVSTTSSSTINSSGTPTGNPQSLSPPSSNSKTSSSSSREESKEKYYSSRPQEQTGNGNNGSSSSSSSRLKRGAAITTSPTSSSQTTQQYSSQQQASSNLTLTPTRKLTRLNEYSPTSSVSSEDLPNSPKRSNSSSQNSGHPTRIHKSHSRSSSPKINQSSSSYYSKNHSSDKSKRLKSSEDSALNGGASAVMTSSTTSGKTYLVNGTNTTGNNNNSGSHEYSSSSSSKRKSSRERGERADKDKKDHRKREHSMDDGGDGHHKRSKSDEAKKKFSSSSSSGSIQTAASSNASSSSSSNKRISKKHETSTIKEEFQPSNSNNGVASGSTNSSKHRSDEGRRSTHDKNSHYMKEKK